MARKITTPRPQSVGRQRRQRYRRPLPSRSRRCVSQLRGSDKSQTDLIDPEAGDPLEVARRLEGGDTLGIYGAVSDYLTAQGWTVTREALPEGINGRTAIDGSRQVAVDADLSPAQAAKTPLHEAPHVILHADEELAEYVAHRGIKETEAESVAYVVAGLLGLDTSAYSIGYVAAWSDCKAEVIKESAARVLRATRALADAITETEEANGEA